MLSAKLRLQKRLFWCFNRLLQFQGPIVQIKYLLIVPHKLTPHTKGKSNTSIKVCEIQISSSRLVQSKLKTWKIVLILYLSIGRTSLRWGCGGIRAALVVRDVPCTWQKHSAFWSQFLLAPLHLDAHPSPFLLFLPALLHAEASPPRLPLAALKLVHAQSTAEEYWGQRSLSSPWGQGTGC